MKKLCAIITTLLVISGVFPVFAADAALPAFGFEDGTTGEFYPADDGSILTVTNTEARSGKSSMLLSVAKNKEDLYSGPEMKFGKYLEPGVIYDVIAWVKLKSPDTATIDIIAYDGKNWPCSVSKTISTKGGWTKLSGKLMLTPSNLDAVVIKVQCRDNAKAEFYIDDFSVTIGESGKGIKDAAKLPSLKGKYKDSFKIGATFGSDTANDVFLSLIKYHYNSYITGWQMTPGALAWAKGEYNFADTDILLKTVFDEGFTIHADALITQDEKHWLNTDASGKPLTRAAAAENLTEYINTVAGRYAGQVYSWDIVSGALDWQEKNGGWREYLYTGNPWYKAFENGADKKKGESGADYIDLAFRLARKADPKAKLYYGDYGLDVSHRAAATAEMIKEINDKWRKEGNTRALIEGVSLKLDYDLNSNAKNAEAAIKLFEKLGLEISVSILNVDIPGVMQTKEQLEKQAQIYAELFTIFKKYSKNIVSVTLLEGTNWTGENNGDLFNKDFTPRPAFYAIADPDKYVKAEEKVKLTSVLSLDFNKGKTDGFVGFGDGVKVTNTKDASHSKNMSVLVTGRSETWNGALFDITDIVEPGAEYEFSVWVLPKTPDFSDFKFTAAIGSKKTQYLYIGGGPVSKAGGWTELKGRIKYDPAKYNLDYMTVYIENATANAEYFIDDFSIKKVTK